MWTWPQLSIYVLSHHKSMSICPSPVAFLTQENGQTAPTFDHFSPPLLVPSFSISTGIQISLTHVDSKLNLTKSKLLQRALQRTKHRIASLTSLTTEIQAPIQYCTKSSSFQMDYTIGTPSLPSTALFDTGSDLIWTQCEPCIKCFNQSTQIYNPSKSTTFTKLPCTIPLCQALPSWKCGPDCNYYYSYGNGTTSTQGMLATETFTFGSENPVTVPSIGFGCSDYNQGNASSGIIGLGRGRFSLVSQLGLGKFSYCLTSFGDSSTSPLLLGSLAVLNGSAAQSTPFIQNLVVPSLYYLSLQGITVGSTLLPISSTDFAFKSDGSGGFIIDSGTTLTVLKEEAFQVLKQEFQSQGNLSVAESSETETIFDVCFPLTDGQNLMEQVPKLIFHFDGADMDFPLNNYLIRGA